MFTQRHTAYKLFIKDLMSNEYVQLPGESDYIKVNDLQVSRARVMATIVNKSIYDEKKSGFLVIDDGSETMRVRGWEDQYDIIDRTNVGDLVDIVGRVRKYNEEVYLIPEVIKKVGPNWFVLRKVELNKDKVKAKPKADKPAEQSSGVKESTNKDEIYELIKKLDKGKGAELKDLMSESKLGKTECLNLVRGLMADGVVFEPKTGKYKALD